MRLIVKQIREHTTKKVLLDTLDGVGHEVIHGQEQPCSVVLLDLPFATNADLDQFIYPNTLYLNTYPIERIAYEMGGLEADVIVEVGPRLC